MAKMAWVANSSLFLRLIFLRIFQGFLPIVLAWNSKYIFDLLGQNLSKRGDIQSLGKTLVPIFILYVAFSSIAKICEPINTYLYQEITREITIKAKGMLFEYINNLEGLTYFENQDFHSAIRLGSRGSVSGPTQVLSLISSIIQNSITIIGFISVLLLVSYELLLLLIISIAPQIFVLIILKRKRFALEAENIEKHRVASYIEELLQNPHSVKEIRIFGLGIFFVNRLMSTIQQLNKAGHDYDLREMFWQSGLALFSSVIAGISFVFIIFQAFWGKITIGDIFLYSSALASFQSSLYSIALPMSTVTQDSLYFRKFIDIKYLAQNSKIIGNHTCSVPHLKTGIEFRDVAFRYTENQDWVLDNFNLFIPSNACLAVTGINGSGKSTIVKLLTRLYDPQKGQILWDGIDIREFEPRELREHMGVIFQDFSRYYLTGQENIGVGNVQSIDSLEAITHAAHKADLHRLFITLPNGYQTMLSKYIESGNRGTELSGGQWQKVALARMFMRNADFFILDEPTSSLDIKTEHEMYANFVKLMGNASSLLISHRIAALKIANFIAVLENGKVIEYGSHSYLIGLKGKYAELHDLQSAVPFNQL